MSFGSNDGGPVGGFGWNGIGDPFLVDKIKDIERESGRVFDDIKTIRHGNSEVDKNNQERHQTIMEKLIFWRNRPS